MFDVLGIGCTAVDDVLFVGTYPAADEKLEIRRCERRFGGLTGAALVAAATLGGRCAFAGLLGWDQLSKAVEGNFREVGVDVEHVPRLDGARPVHAVIVVGEETGTRNIFYDVSAPSGAHPELPSAELIRGSKVLFLDHLGVAGGVRAARIGREAGVPVVADLEQEREVGFTELFDLVDHLVLSERFAYERSGALGPVEAVEKLWDERRDTVAVTCGDRGVWFKSKESSEVGHQPAFQVSVKDTTGCGDVFHGAYALALAWGWDAARRIRFASAAAGLKAALGGPFPTRAQVEELLAG